MRRMLPLLLAAALLLAACAPQPAASAGEPAHSLTGVVQGTSKNAFSLLADQDGVLYIFATEGAELEVGARGLLAGDAAEVFYTGTLQPGLENAAQPVAVSRVVLLAEAEKVISGTVAALEADLLDLDAEDGTRYRFILGDAELDTGGGGLLAGDAVTLTYSGVLDPTQSVQPVGVHKVEVTAQMEENVTGVVVDATMDTLQITTTSGIRYAFSTAGAVINPGPNGLILGDIARVWFSGALDAGADLQPVTVNRVEVAMEAPKPASSSAPPASSAASSGGGWSRPASGSASWNTGDGGLILPPDLGGLGEHFVSGTATAIDGTALQIESAGFAYLFSIAGAAVSGDISAGDSVAVFYYGTLEPLQTAQTVIVTRVSITGWGGSAVKGTVVESTATSLTIETADGKTYRFNTRNAEVETDADGILPGDAVSVYYTGALDGTREDQAVPVVRVVEH